jgi:hypothetical protein
MLVSWGRATLLPAVVKSSIVLNTRWTIYTNDGATGTRTLRVHMPPVSHHPRCRFCATSAARRMEIDLVSPTDVGPPPEIDVAMVYSSRP